MPNKSDSEKKAYIILVPNVVYVDGEEKPNAEDFFLDGNGYTVPFEREVMVPLALAKHLKDIGRIRTYKEAKQ